MPWPMIASPATCHFVIQSIATLADSQDGLLYRAFASHAGGGGGGVELCKWDNENFFRTNEMIF